MVNPILLRMYLSTRCCTDGIFAVAQGHAERRLELCGCPRHVLCLWVPPNVPFQAAEDDFDSFVRYVLVFILSLNLQFDPSDDLYFTLLNLY